MLNTASFLSLPDAQILHIQGWGQQYDSDMKVRIELAPRGEFAVYRQGFFGEKKIIWLNIVCLELQAWTDTVQSGGGFIGGGFGITGAAQGMLGAAVLNALTTKRREYAMLGAFTFSQDGSYKNIVFGFRNMKEPALRKCITDAVPKWSEEFISHLLPRLAKPLTPQEINGTYEEIDNMLARNILGNEQHARLEAALTKQGQRARPLPNSTVSMDRIAQLKALADLRESGALTDAEFQIEKARLLAGT